MNPRCEVITWNRFHALARKLSRQIHDSGYQPEVIVAIGRVPRGVLIDILAMLGAGS